MENILSHRLACDLSELFQRGTQVDRDEVQPRFLIHRADRSGQMLCRLFQDIFRSKIGNEGSFS